MSKIFIPSLDEQQDDVVTDAKSIVQRILAFLIVNPGDTSELHEEVVGSLGKIDMEHLGDASVVPIVYQEMIQGHIDRAFGHSKFTVDVSSKGTSQEEAALNISIFDEAGNIIAIDKKIVQKIKTE